MKAVPFERGATYRAKEAFEAMRDRFTTDERLVYFHHAQSFYDGAQGWFFYVVGAPEVVRSWDIDGLGDPPSPTPFERIADVDAIVVATTQGDAIEVERLANARAVDDPYLRVAMNVAVEEGRASVVAAILRSGKLPEDRRVRALTAAASAGQLEVVVELLDGGVPAVDEAIWDAVWSGSTAIVELLVARGANPRKTSQTIDSMLAFCERQNRPRIAEILERYR